jgi:hypothetical protein
MLWAKAQISRLTCLISPLPLERAAWHMTGRAGAFPNALYMSPRDFSRSAPFCAAPRRLHSTISSLDATTFALKS